MEDSTLALHHRHEQKSADMGCNILNRTIFCHDNIDVLSGINTECIDLIYLDPPFNKKKIFSAPIGTTAEGASFKDIFTRQDVKEEWVQSIKEDYFSIHRLLEAVRDIEGRQSYNFCYLCYMAIRLIECHRILKDTGSLYLHCDQTMSHYLKLLLDCIFGESNFRNEVIWRYGKMQNAKNNYPQNHDSLLFYTKNYDYVFNILKGGESEYRERWKKYIKNNKIYYRDMKHKNDKMLIARIEKKQKEGKLTDDTVLYDFDKEYKTLDNNWYVSIIKGNDKQKTGYPTQKPLALLERIIRASSNEGDVVLDPFCGCATTCVAAEKLNRQWIGVDISYKAFDLIRKRLDKEVKPNDDLFNWDNEVHFTLSLPQRTDREAHAEDMKYVYVISHKKYTGYYKVGITSNIKNRLNSYQTGDPHRAYELQFSLKRGNYRETERYIHDKYHSAFEWVQGNVQDIINDIKTYDPHAEDLL